MSINAYLTNVEQATIDLIRETASSMQAYCDSRGALGNNGEDLILNHASRVLDVARTLSLTCLDEAQTIASLCDWLVEQP